MRNNRQFLVAYIWNFAGKLIIRGLGIVSTLFLVRLLSPEDFGIVAIAMVFIGLFNVLTDSGINRYLILHKDPSEDIYHSAWTLNLLLRLFAFILILISAPLLSSFMQDDRLVFVAQIAGLTGFIGAFNSIELVKLERAIDFAPFNKMQMMTKVIAIIVTISAAFLYRSYYALLIGSFLSAIILMSLSYLLTGSRPKLAFNFNKEIFTFSIHLLGRNIFGY